MLSTMPSSVSFRNEFPGAPTAGSRRLCSIRLIVAAGHGPLRPQIVAALAHHGDPLRWAITEVRTPTGRPGGRDLCVEAVLLTS
jgi:hypothetical protein